MQEDVPPPHRIWWSVGVISSDIVCSGERLDIDISKFMARTQL